MSEMERGLTNDGGAIESDLQSKFCHYQDDGCELAESCLKCPFPQCHYEQSHGKRHWLKKARDWEIARLYKSKKFSYRELGRVFGVSKRTVGRAVKEVTSEGKEPLLPVNLRKGSKGKVKNAK